jgi:hypothetical protein
MTPTIVGRAVITRQTHRRRELPPSRRTSHPSLTSPLLVSRSQAVLILAPLTLGGDEAVSRNPKVPRYGEMNGPCHAIAAERIVCTPCEVPTLHPLVDGMRPLPWKRVLRPHSDSSPCGNVSSCGWSLARRKDRFDPSRDRIGRLFNAQQVPPSHIVVHLSLSGNVRGTALTHASQCFPFGKLRVPRSCSYSGFRIAPGDGAFGAYAPFLRRSHVHHRSPWTRVYSSPLHRRFRTGGR